LGKGRKGGALDIVVEAEPKEKKKGANEPPFCLSLGKGGRTHRSSRRDVEEEKHLFLPSRKAGEGSPTPFTKGKEAL